MVELKSNPKRFLPAIKSDSSHLWKIEDSEELYRIKSWGQRYFSINAAGHITVCPKGDRGGSLDLFELVNALKQRNLELPLLIHFSDVLEDCIEWLNSCFAKAITHYNYPGIYRGVFPIKCNPQRHLIEDLVRLGKPHQFGLEAGSKPELMIALAQLDTAGALIICNGYKDREYIETAMLAQRLGKTPIIVLEQIEEVNLVIAVNRQLGIKPILGVRAKLSTQGVGRWGTSTGKRAKFGLTIPEIIQVVDKLREANLLDSLQLLHFHIGSQVCSINAIKDAIKEASRIYVELAVLETNMNYLDVGGGLAVDYDGSQSNFHASRNYTIQNYANDIVAEVKESCSERNIPVPTLISESGRAIASHQSVLVFDTLSVSQVSFESPEPPLEGESPIITHLWEIYQSIHKDNFQEPYHDVTQLNEEARSRFNFGLLNITERAKAEKFYWACHQKILNITRQLEYIPDELSDLEKIMASIYYINLSVFQSSPDCWAIDQLFPIMPIHCLDEEPTQRGILADLTCDSDGKIDRFIALRDVKPILELHSIKSGKPYYLGMFLQGAYQEVMGNLHNLFGDTNAVHIHLTPKGYQIEHVVKGDTITEVLGYMQYNSDDLAENIRKQIEQALQEKHITLTESQRLQQNYEQSLSQYTYLSS
ncbi:biosynthetic arginine decarboxylase [Synechococcus sp. PCC 7336]|uniref:biosynthetic arginine decarboxylase n=1 Tax=Synechococcus sp. PCC 7336 TaxID=195250 RepID=UPI00350F0A0E